MAAGVATFLLGEWVGNASAAITTDAGRVVAFAPPLFHEVNATAQDAHAVVALVHTLVARTEPTLMAPLAAGIAEARALLAVLATCACVLTTLGTTVLVMAVCVLWGCLRRVHGRITVERKSHCAHRGT